MRNTGTLASRRRCKDGGAVLTLLGSENAREMERSMKNSHPGRRLPEHIRSDGFDLRLVERHGMVALYEKMKGFHAGYEVVVIQLRKPKKHPFTGVDLPLREAYPSSEDWGTYGWTYTTLERAQARMKRLNG